MDFLKDAQRATLKTNTYINDNGSSLIDLLLLLVTPVIALDVLRQLFTEGGIVWLGMSFLYLCLYMLIPTLWLRSTVESKDPDRDFISYLASSKTYLTNLILILVAIIYIKIPDIAAFTNQFALDSFGMELKHTKTIIVTVLSLLFLRLSFLIPLYISGLDLSYKQALEATRGKAAALAATIIVTAAPLFVFTVLYLLIITPWLVENVFHALSQDLITMILVAPAKYLAIPLIFIYSFTALAYHYANYARQYLVMNKDADKPSPKKEEMN